MGPPAAKGHELLSRLRRVRWYQAVLYACGAALFAGLIVEIGPASIVASFTELSWRLLVIVVFPAVVIVACDTLGWRFAFVHNPVSILTLARIPAGRSGGQRDDADRHPWR